MTAVPAPSATPLIHLHGLSKVFHTEEVETHALAEIALDVAPGDFVAITGPSGCGKSTLLSILGLLDAPSGGTYRLNGRSVAELDTVGRARIRNAEIGFIFQAFNLIADLTVEENVALPLTYRDGAQRSQIRQRVREVLELVGMQHRHKHYPGQLSGGQQQRVAVARALAGNPTILLADEPTGNLDSRNGEAVMQLLEQLHDHGTTLCMVTHDPAFARRAQRIVHMLDGRIVDEDTFERLRHEQDVALPARAAGQAR
ncbi:MULTISPECIES: ABC transporter ATP-binding protein [unclassified Xanthomonas]|uniref:ABC transporter ATP-binding protein n=1 Tax=unclassified Xanthomonas TaxID=2643310 RepID=UPI002A81D6D3|nr:MULTISPECIES: ABC transporter ATP-binding protein [unclassified Xanthomonas]MDY4294852.1 ABC transporter ATP-binding protein [Xanthomonas sp. LF02-5]MDY4356651.1 ABC transporter ATP-binding protein [Xanthomonas sp. LF04-12]